MKKLISLLALLSLYTISYSQTISFAEESNEIKGTDKNNRFNKNEKTVLIKKRNRNDSIAVDEARKEIDSIFYRFDTSRLSVIKNVSITKKDATIDTLIKKRDSVLSIQKQKIKLINYWQKYDRYEDYDNKHFNFIPAYYSSQAIRFFEDDTTHLKFFANNNINYNPVSRKMTLYTEAINDYFGPFRLGIGFQIRSDGKADTTKGADTAKLIEKKQDLLTALQNGGGDISLNVKYPFIKQLNAGSLFHYKIYLYANTGFSLPVLNKATTDFYLNYDLGMEGVLYAKGFNNKITFFNQTKAAYFFGNRNYRKIITDLNADDPTSFFALQSSFGLDFLDGYRLRVDLFAGNKFVRNNFPATITFTIRPGKGK